jgi:hypothetical protein
MTASMINFTMLSAGTGVKSVMMIWQGPLMRFMDLQAFIIFCLPDQQVRLLGLLGLSLIKIT